MRTPSLRRRVVVLGVMVVVVVLASVNGFLYLAFRAQLGNNLNATLRERAEIVRREANVRSGPGLATRLTELGLRATVRSPDGAVYAAEPPSPILGNNLPYGGATSMTPTVSRSVSLPDGSVATVFARKAGIENAARQLLVLDAAGLVLAGLLAALLLRRTSGFALRPLQEIAASARRTSAGHRGERLRPDRTDTSLGQLAAAYDDMLDTLEASEKRASDAQMESELLYLHLRQVIETAKAGFIGMNSSGLITDWNSEAEEIFGWSRNKILGRSLADTIIPESLRAAHGAGLHRFLTTGEHRILGDNVEFDALHRDGDTIPVEVATWVTQVGDEVTFNAFVRDITERRKGEEAIGRLASIVKSAQEAILSTSLDGTILTWNLGAERLYCYSAEEAIGQHVSLIVPSDRAGEITTIRDHAVRGEGVSRYETVRGRKDGSEVHVAITSSPIFDGWGAVTGASTIARDITEQHQMAEALRETMNALERAVDEARSSEERSRQFLADAAHQLRSPIAGVRACAETLLRGTLERDRDELLAGLVRETARAGRLISSLLRLARIDQGVRTELQQCDVVTLCQSEVERTRLLAPELKVVLESTDLADEHPEVDANSVTEILSNLLDNARRHAVTSIRVTVHRKDDNLQILIADDGSGIRQEEVGMIFHRFVSLDGKGGSGLGLPIARGLAQACGGDLAYDNDGFRLTLPLQSRVGDDVWLRTSSR